MVSLVSQEISSKQNSFLNDRPMSEADKKPLKDKPLEVPEIPNPVQDPLKEAPDEAPQIPKPDSYPERKEKEVPVPNPTEKPEINDPEITPGAPQDSPEPD